MSGAAAAAVREVLWWFRAGDAQGAGKFAAWWTAHNRFRCWSSHVIEAPLEDWGVW
ncbi:hypothetical protein O1L55_02345 [Streptomyces albulus]|nr:hypothetical protein [Streptomyces noursei]